MSSQAAPDPREPVLRGRLVFLRPAERDGERIAVRVLLRYNFRKPPKT